MVLQDAGISIVHAGDETQALARWASEMPDAILICEGPGLDALALTRRLRQETVVPVILLSGRTDEAYVLSAYDAGVNDCLSLPISPTLLVAKVKAWLRRARVMPFNGLVSLSSQGLTLDPQASAARLPDGREVRLSNLEFRLLYSLMAHQGQPVSAEALLDRVWGYEGGDGELLKRLVYRLRRKVEPDPAHPRYVRTVRGAGYVFGQE